MAAQTVLEPGRGPSGLTTLQSVLPWPSIYAIQALEDKVLASLPNVLTSIGPGEGVVAPFKPPGAGTRAARNGGAHAE